MVTHKKESAHVWQHVGASVSEFHVIGRETAPSFFLIATDTVAILPHLTNVIELSTGDGDMVSAVVGR